MQCGLANEVIDSLAGLALRRTGRIESGDLFALPNLEQRFLCIVGSLRAVDWARCGRVVGTIVDRRPQMR